ncbi:hypothetical protein Taro_013402, partial [Colocasia esculenta]|nr:hypothetical protein [Colocasia esculenta]
QHLEDDLQKLALKIEHHEENMRSLKSQINKIDEFINDMQDFNVQLENDASETSSKIENIKDNAIDRLQPSEGMEFDTVEEAQIFYNTYAKNTGFVITTVDSKFSDGKCLRKLLACRKYGEPRRDPTAPVHRYSPKVGCTASVKVKLDKVSGKWRLHNVVIEHNHYLSPLAVSGLRSCKRICTSKEAKVRNMHRVGTSTSNIAIKYKRLPLQLENDAQKIPTEIGNLKGNATDVVQPSKGMEFDTVEQAQIFYNTYAKSTGFGITTVESNSRDGKCVYKHFACWKYGAPRRIPTARVHRPSHKVGCMASIKVKFDKASGKLTLSDVIIEHNHELNPLSCVYLRSHQRTCTSEKAEVKGIHAEGISTSNAVSCIPKRESGMHQLQFTDKDSRSLFDGEHQTPLEEAKKKKKAFLDSWRALEKLKALQRVARAIHLIYVVYPMCRLHRTTGCQLTMHPSALPEEDAWKVTCRQAEEQTIEHILKQDKTAAAIACSMTNCHALQATKLPLIKDVLGVVATLGKVNDENISRLLSEYAGLEMMLAIVCKNYESVKALEEYDRDGVIDKNAGLHELGPSIGRLLDGRFLVICLENLRQVSNYFVGGAYTGEFAADDPQRQLALLKPKLPSGKCPPGFLGFAVNMISVDMKYVSCITSNGHGLRETLFYSLFSHLQVYRSREEMRLAIPFISDGAISLDGGIIKGAGLFSLGERIFSDSLFTWSNLGSAHNMSPPLFIKNFVIYVKCGIVIPNNHSCPAGGYGINFIFDSRHGLGSMVFLNRKGREEVRDDVEVRFPVCSGLSNVPLNIKEKLKIMKWEKEMHAEDFQREEVLFNHATDLFNSKKQELLQHLREAAQYVNQVSLRSEHSLETIRVLPETGPMSDPGFCQLEKCQPILQGATAELLHCFSQQQIPDCQVWLLFLRKRKRETVSEGLVDLRKSDGLDVNLNDQDAN